MDNLKETVTDSHEPWPSRLRRLCLVAGYGDVLFGRCDVLGLDTDGRRFCETKPHPDGPRIGTWPALWTLLERCGVNYCSASCHWVGIDTRALTPQQREELEAVAVSNWATEWYDYTRA